jgi:peptidoglycan hydrolase CwlO-like protein
MGRGSKVLFLILCITAAGISAAGAASTPIVNNPNIARIQQLKQEMQGLQKQLIPLYSQVQVLMTQINAIKAQIHPLEGQMKADRDQMQSLVGKYGKN